MTVFQVNSIIQQTFYLLIIYFRILSLDAPTKPFYNIWRMLFVMTSIDHHSVPCRQFSHAMNLFYQICHTQSSPFCKISLWMRRSSKVHFSTWKKCWRNWYGSESPWRETDFRVIMWDLIKYKSWQTNSIFSRTSWEAKSIERKPRM